MTWRAAVERDFAANGIAIHLGDQIGEGMVRLLKPTELVYEVLRYPETIEVHSPALRLDDDLGRALFDALALYYGGGGQDARTSREDMLAERKRADRLIEALITVATRP